MYTITVPMSFITELDSHLDALILSYIITNYIRYKDTMDNFWFYTSYKSMANTFSTTKLTVSKSVKRLQDKNLIHVRKQKHNKELPFAKQSNLYKPNFQEIDRLFPDVQPYIYNLSKYVRNDTP